MMRTNFLYLILFVAYSLFAANDVASSMNKQKDTNTYNDYEEVLYEHLKENESKVIKIADATKKTWHYIPPEDPNANKDSDNNSTQKDTNDTNVIFVSGYCFGQKKSIEISKLSAYAYMKCNFDDVNAQLAALLVPDAFSKALIGKGLYLKTDTKHYTVVGGVIMNSEKTSLNLAHIVNDRKIESFLAETGIKTADIATTQAQAYLDDLKDSRTNQQAVYQSSANTDRTVVVTNSEKPVTSDYLFAGGVQFVSAMAKAGAEIFKEDLPYLFTTKESAIYFVDLMVVDAKQGQLPNLSIEGKTTTITRNPNREAAKKQSDVSLKDAQEATTNKRTLK